MGASVTMLVAARFEASNPSNIGFDTLFLAILLGALISIFLQLHQWLGLELSDVWLMEVAGERPYANLGQPNQLATLLGWGIVAVAWFHHRQKIRGWWAFAASVLLVFGMSLTQSRTALLLVIWLVVISGLLRVRAGDQRYWGPSLMLAGCYGLAAWGAPAVKQMLWGLGGGSDSIRVVTDTASVHVRTVIYRLFLDASLQSPWVGYGWGQAIEAQLKVALEHEPLHMTVSHVHNLLLDLVIAIGWPLGLLCFGSVMWWWFRAHRLARDAENLLPLTAITLVGIHAMLELPLHYGYFLWPTAWMAGALNWRLGFRSAVFGGRVVLLTLLGLLGGFLAMAAYDYVRVEENWRAIRFEQNRVGLDPAPPAPEILVLTQLADLLWLVRVEPTDAWSTDQVRRLERTVRLYPSLPGILKIARAYALRGDGANARRWLLLVPVMVSDAQAEIGRDYWKELQKDDRYSKVPWPSR
jgi:hypothetical protein